MLPGAVAGVLGALGITGSSALARTLSPVAGPLFIASAALVVISALTCSRLVVLLSTAGAVLLDLSMFQLATASTGSATGSMSMMAMHGRCGRVPTAVSLSGCSQRAEYAIVATSAPCAARRSPLLNRTSRAAS
jgi:hypothetical protein